MPDPHIKEADLRGLKNFDKSTPLLPKMPFYTPYFLIFKCFFELFKSFILFKHCIHHFLQNIAF